MLWLLSPNMNSIQSESVRVSSEQRQTVDGSELRKELGIDRSEIRWRKSFTDFTSDDIAALAELDELIESEAPALTDELERHIHDHEEALVFLDRSTKSFDQLKQAHTSYLTDLGSGSYDKEYFNQRARIGQIHNMLGLGPKIYLGAYSVYFGGLVDAIGKRMKERTEEGALTPDELIDQTVEYVMALFKIINIDQQVVMDTYIHAANENLKEELDRQRRVASEVDDLVTESQKMAENVAERSAEIHTLSDRQTENIASVAEEVSNMSATVEEIAATADDVAATSQNAEELASDGQEAATRAIDAMETVDRSTRDVAADVDQLRERVDEIDEVVEVISDIADQTNLLALNASIEAAHADESGDGFAVVANEVKSLAEESQDNAKQIEKTVDAIKAETEETVESLDEMTTNVSQGIDRVEDAMAKLQDIVETVEEASEGIQEVSDATDDQAASTEEVASMIDELVEQTEEVAQEIESISDSNGEQEEKIDEIYQTVQSLTE
ncbi:heme-based aerotactic transducer [Halopiger aswanensis]|uniref:Heme-based aerotactic transducer n=2 Tax=Halopiger aswanensis TaxID=148449 RepID=A0A3R7DAP4_9EURY|nr:heme-based aerotactic transducer [Halopiger aswanensis]